MNLTMSKADLDKAAVSITDGTSKASLADARTSVVVRLRPDVYKRLETKLSKLVVHQSSTAIEVGYQLGVQAVLSELRNGYVVEEA